MEPTTGLVILEDEFCVACPACNELLIRREALTQTRTQTLTPDP